METMSNKETVYEKKLQMLQEIFPHVTIEDIRNCEKCIRIESLKLSLPLGMISGILAYRFHSDKVPKLYKLVTAIGFGGIGYLVGKFLYSTTCMSRHLGNRVRYPSNEWANNIMVGKYTPSTEMASDDTLGNDTFSSDTSSSYMPNNDFEDLSANFQDYDNDYNYKDSGNEFEDTNDTQEKEENKQLRRKRVTYQTLWEENQMKEKQAYYKNVSRLEKPKENEWTNKESSAFESEDEPNVWR